MSSEWIFDQPPPAPPVHAQTPHGHAQGQQRGRGRGRGGQRHRDGTRPGQAGRPDGSAHTAPLPAVWTPTLTPTAVGSAAAISKYYPAAPAGVQQAGAVLSELSALSPLSNTAYAQPAVTASAHASHHGSVSATGSSLNASIAHVAAAATTKIITPTGQAISLDTPEDLAAWIAERKRKWPTDANVQAKRAQAQQVPLGKKRGHQDVATETTRKKRKTISQPAKTAQDSLEEGEIVEGSTIIPASGQHANASSSDSDASTSDSDSDGDSSDASDSGPEQLVATTAIPTMQSTQSRTLCKYFRQGRCTRGAACTFSHDAHLKAKLDEEAKQKRQQQQRAGQQQKQDAYKWRTRKPLFELLVEREVAQEKEQADAAAKHQQQQQQQTMVTDTVTTSAPASSQEQAVVP